MSHTHYFPRILPVDGEDCIASGKCECGLTKYFLDYYGATKDGISLWGLARRVDELNVESVTEFERIRVPVPPKGNRVEMHDYYTRNRARIKDEVVKYGFRVTACRWGVSRKTILRIIKTVMSFTLQ
jgi:hypothetical protein